MKKDMILKLKIIKEELKKGRITYDKAKELAGPMISLLDKEAEKIAKKHGRKHYPFSFSKLMQ